MKTLLLRKKNIIKIILRRKMNLQGVNTPHLPRYNMEEVQSHQKSMIQL